MLKPIKQTKCKICRTPFTKRNISHKVCSVECSAILGKEINDKKLLKEEVEAIKINNDFQKAKQVNSDTKKLNADFENTKTQTHEYVRLRDEGKNCSSCDVLWNKEFQACHFYKAETNSSIRFDLDNIHGGCKRCNLFLDGNFEGYSLRLPKVLGKERFAALTARFELGKKFTKQWTRTELKEIRQNVSKLKRELRNK